jgi:hypothetical protein
MLHTYITLQTYITHTHTHSYKLKLIRVQRLINIKTAKAYHTLSNEALCMLTGLTPIAIKIKEAIQFYKITRGSTKRKHWSIVAGELNIGITPQK